MRPTFKKAERLKKTKLIEEVFHSGSSLHEHPFRVSWVIKELDTPFPAQVLISVSKKKIKKANQRNLIKRRIKEAYRLNKHILYSSLKNYGKQMAFSIVYTGNDVMKYQPIEEKIILTLQRIAKQVDENSGQ